MPTPRISIPDDAPPVMGPSAAYQGLDQRAEIAYHDSLPGSEAELIERIRGFDAVINIRSSVDFTDAVFAACPDLRIVSLWGTGTDHVDAEAAVRHGVTVTNTPGVSAVAMAEHTLTLMLSAARTHSRSGCRNQSRRVASRLCHAIARQKPSASSALAPLAGRPPVSPAASA